MRSGACCACCARHALACSELQLWHCTDQSVMKVEFAPLSSIAGLPGIPADVAAALAALPAVQPPVKPTVPTVVQFSDSLPPLPPAAELAGGQPGTDYESPAPELLAGGGGPGAPLAWGDTAGSSAATVVSDGSTHSALGLGGGVPWAAGAAEGGRGLPSVVPLGPVAPIGVQQQGAGGGWLGALTPQSLPPAAEQEGRQPAGAAAEQPPGGLGAAPAAEFPAAAAAAAALPAVVATRPGVCAVLLPGPMPSPHRHAMCQCYPGTARFLAVAVGDCLPMPCQWACRSYQSSGTSCFDDFTLHMAKCSC